MNIINLIAKKQSGKDLSEDEIIYLINSYTSGEIPDYQMAAFLMSVYFQEMSQEELYNFTNAMLNSGEKIDTSTIPGIKIDKHSTGGVGDKVSIILAPLVASAGVIVPMISGRGLGHSGGTLDKLESIPGFKTNLSIYESKKKLAKIGVVFMGQTDTLVPADKKMYALRDTTSTIKSISLITASILSKKLAEGIDGLVIDLKVGKGAFFKNQKYGLKLAEKLITISEKFSLKTSVLFTAMDEPLGFHIGNWQEIKEAIEVLKGNGPNDLIDVTLALGAEMLVQAKIERKISSAIEKLKQILSSGAAYSKFLEIVKNQGGKVKYIENPDLYNKSKHHYIIKSERRGYVSNIDALKIGQLAMTLGAGRKTIDDKIDYKAGIVLPKKIGFYVERNEPIAEIFTDKDIPHKILEEQLLNAIKIVKIKLALPNPLLGYATKTGMSRWPY